MRKYLTSDVIRESLACRRLLFTRKNLDVLSISLQETPENWVPRLNRSSFSPIWIRYLFHHFIYIKVFFKPFRAYSSCFIHAIIARMRLPFFIIFSIFYIFVQIFKHFAFVAIFCLFSENSHVCPYFLE